MSENVRVEVRDEVRDEGGKEGGNVSRKSECFGNI